MCRHSLTPGRVAHTIGCWDRPSQAAADGDALAMSGLGHLYLLGDACSPKRNLTWATHWLDGAAELGQPDALAMLGFLAESKALQRVYNYTAHPAGADAGQRARARALARARLTEQRTDLGRTAHALLRLLRDALRI